MTTSQEAATGQDREIPNRDTDPGTPGVSARREHERRRAKREADIRTKHARLGPTILAIQPEPQSTTAWATGAEGEEQCRARLNAAATTLLRVLHDRRIVRYWKAGLWPSSIHGAAC
jgi:hypothetical protein